VTPFGIGRGKKDDEEPRPPAADEPAGPSKHDGTTSGDPLAQQPATVDQPAPIHDPQPEVEPERWPETVVDQPAAGQETVADDPGYDETEVGHPAHETEVDHPAHDETEADAEPETGRVAVVSESGYDEDEYKWHTGLKRPTGKPDAIEFIDVHKAFGRNRILKGLNMGLPEGMISMILGPSGTGKSVCIKHMVGLLYPDDGDVIIHGESVPNMRDDELFAMRRKFGVLFQDGALFGSMNLLDNVAFPLRQHTDKSEEEILDIVNRRLQEVGLADAGDKMPNELSGGMRKRAGFARALVLDPDIVLFDEPDSGLDPVRTALLCELIQEVHAENGGAYVVITHDIASARRVAEHISVLWKGRIVESGPAEELFNSDNAFVRQFLSGEAQGPLGME